MDGDTYIQALTKWVQREGKRLAQPNPSPPIALSLHHLYYILTRFDDLEVPIGPLNVRLENIDDDHQPSGTSSSNYVSFSRKNSDAASIRSVSSIRSVMSTVSSSVWTGFGMFGSGARTEEQIANDLKQLYSAFCKIPTIRICPNKSVKPITGFEEYPFDTAVPLLAFKNLQFLETFNYSPKQFYGWDEMSEQLRGLVVKRSGLDDIALLTIGVIRKELEKKKRKAERTTRHWQNISDGFTPTPNSPRPTTHPSMSQSKKQTQTQDRPRSTSPNSSAGRPVYTTRNSSRYAREHSSSSSSSDTSVRFVLPPTKWRFLRYLSLSDNGLSQVSVEALAPLVNNLNFLDLSNNQFSSVPAALSTLSSLRSLDMTKNKIESLHSLLQNPLPGITTLSIRGNILRSIAGIERLPSLERVDLRNNLLKDPTELARLNTAPNIAEIWVEGNPFTRTHYDYRISIFNSFRTNAGMNDDITLDGKKPGMIEKRSLVPRAVEFLPIPKVISTSSSNSPAQTKNVTNSPRSAHAIEEVVTDERRQSNDSADHSVKPKRKVHKSRIIDLSAAPQGSPESKSGAHLTKGLLVSSTDVPLQGENVHGDLYRKKIEALKQEVGGDWLRVINEDSFRSKT